MKNIFFLSILICLYINTFAQEALWGGQEIISPQINADNIVTFRFYNPNAAMVQVSGDFLPAQKLDSPNGPISVPGAADLVKGENGIWEYTTPQPLASELYNYSFTVDGMKVADPNNVYLVRDVASLTNIFLISGGQGDYYGVNAVPHGTVSRRWYNSPTLGMDRRITIYTPPGYESDGKNYPVLYLLHGMGGDEEAWSTLGRATQILDNLIAQGKAEPMIVVMSNGNAIQEAAPGESSLGFYKPVFALPKTMEGTMEASFPDIVNFIDANYRTIPDKSHRAIAGLSMGGFHSLHISKEYPDVFDYVGLFSAAILPEQGVNGAVKSPVYENMDEKLRAQFEKTPQLYWIAIGKTDFLYKANEDYRAYLDKKGYPYVYVETEGGHIWKNWRIYLVDFVSQLFK